MSTWHSWNLQNQCLLQTAINVHNRHFYYLRAIPHSINFQLYHNNVEFNDIISFYAAMAVYTAGEIHSCHKYLVDIAHITTLQNGLYGTGASSYCNGCKYWDCFKCLKFNPRYKKGVQLNNWSFQVHVSDSCQRTCIKEFLCRQWCAFHVYMNCKMFHYCKDWALQVSAY